MFNPQGKPTITFQVTCSTSDTWTMVLEPPGTGFENLSPTEKITIEFVASTEPRYNIPCIDVYEKNYVAVELVADYDDVRITNSSGVELEI
ncbi:hypothetical protein [Mycobacterium sp. D16R24]|uniref:hypothetical protein n=1 Tax=Mycobacterium sp. D16R24 TaxID=1855656 RepID=UPI001115E37F|nr:hypothetical protein [Mycobacterium sp. D16R24]